MKSILKYMTFALVIGLVFYGVDALAAGDGENVFQRAATTLLNVFKATRKVVYIIGAFGLIGVAIGGIMGKIIFKWLGYLAAGLAILAAAGWFLDYVTGDAVSGADTEVTVDWDSVSGSGR